MTCPNCYSAQIEVREVRICNNGTRRRRHECLACSHRWTSWDGPRPIRGYSPNGRRKPAQGKRGKLTPAEIKRVLTQLDLNNKQLAAELGCSCETIRQVRAGMLYASIHPELLRPKAKRPAPPPVDGPTCLGCVHWKGSRCSFDFPDPVMEGITFAADCDLYEMSQSISRACPSSVQ
jgi:hypothetical protein